MDTDYQSGFIKIGILLFGLTIDVVLFSFTILAFPTKDETGYIKLMLAIYANLTMITGLVLFSLLLTNMYYCAVAYHQSIYEEAVQRVKQELELTGIALSEEESK